MLRHVFERILKDVSLDPLGAQRSLSEVATFREFRIRSLVLSRTFFGLWNDGMILFPHFSK